jgi:hypothetical protein
MTIVVPSRHRTSRAYPAIASPSPILTSIARSSPRLTKVGCLRSGAFVAALPLPRPPRRPAPSTTTKGGGVAGGDDAAGGGGRQWIMKKVLRTRGGDEEW